MDLFNDKDTENLIKIREEIKKDFYKILKNKSKSKIIEDSIFRYTIDYIGGKNMPVIFEDNFKSNYLLKVCSIYSNIDPKNKSVQNINLSKKIKNNEIDLKNIAFMKPQELFPERWKEILDKNKATKHFLYEEKKEVETDQFKCMKCKIDPPRCSYYTLQIRSCDEPETCFITCLNCSYKWKE